jgi:hypothetical protein
MSEANRIPSAIEQGDSGAAEQLLPLVYDERPCPLSLLPRSASW